MNKNNFAEIKKLLRFAYNNPYSDFYREKYKKAGFNPLSDFNSIKDVERIPFLTKEELSSVNTLNLLFTPEKEIEFVSTTSSTTGKPLSIFHSQLKVRNLPENEKKGKTFALFNSFRLIDICSSYKIRSKNKNIIFTGDIHNLPASCQLASDLRINIIYTTPSMAIILKDYIDRYPNLKKSLKAFLLTGEFVGTEKKRFLQKLYPDLEIFINYGLSEIGRIGFQCKHLIKKSKQVYYHISKIFDYYLENVDPIKGKEMAFGEKGELTITTFWNKATPLIRYKTGDLISLKKNDCPCDLPGHLLQTWGRKNYDIVKAGGIEFKAHMLEKPILNLRNYLKEDFKADFYEKHIGNKPKITIALNLSLKEGVEESQLLKQRIQNEFLENWQLSSRINLKKALEIGLLESFLISFIKFPKSQKPTKSLILH